ncbi:MAG: hypothetical protein ACRC2V_28080 [Xenococcaceae cyanobacterium]
MRLNDKMRRSIYVRISSIAIVTSKLESFWYFCSVTAVLSKRNHKLTLIHVNKPLLDRSTS